MRYFISIKTFTYDFVLPTKKANGKRLSLSPSQGYKLVGNAVLAYHIAKKSQIGRFILDYNYLNQQ